jgi:hypothetical protein
MKHHEIDLEGLVSWLNETNASGIAARFCDFKLQTIWMK